jgi:cell division protease FtsH
MSPDNNDRWRPPEPPGRPPRPPVPPRAPSSRSRWLPWVFLGLLVTALLVYQGLPNSGTSSVSLTYSQFLADVRADRVATIKYDSSSGHISGEFKKGREVGGKATFSTTGPTNQMPDADIALLNAHGVGRDYKSHGSNIIGSILTLLLPIVLILGFFIWMSRRAQGQMGAVMNIGRSRAKVYNTEKPKTTFADVAGYGPVKEEIKEVVDFLKMPGKFRDIGARIPKGVLLVGPPGTGKTLIARAVAGEAGVPFISVTGSDFMEMFVGVGAARVRDLFNTARKQAPAIIFVDEIDSIGRKRGAGLGGGHDEREQTLNQMLAEMDGFETTEGVVMMAATNRPDVLDPALLRPGRFDRQILVPLPTQEERLQILLVHFRDKKMAPDVDPDIVARGTPGMSGADLANLVNEAALFAVRRGAQEVHKQDFDEARDRVLMGLKRPSVVMSAEEKQLTAYHEGGHALCAYVLDNADPVHKVTILPTGMALGMTQQLPIEEQHAYNKRYIEDMLAVMLGGRVAEEVVFKNVSTGAQNDLVRATEIARKMVREWGMSDRIGPMAWGSQGAVFLGDDLMHTRDYSDETARVIDEEVEAILREQEQRTEATLTKFRPALDAIAKGLLERETLDGDEVTRLADEAMGFKAGGARTPVQPNGVVPPSVPDGNGTTSPQGAPPTPPAPPPPMRPPFTPASGG